MPNLLRETARSTEQLTRLIHSHASIYSQEAHGESWAERVNKSSHHRKQTESEGEERQPDLGTEDLAAVVHGKLKHDVCKCIRVVSEAPRRALTRDAQAMSASEERCQRVFLPEIL